MQMARQAGVDAFEVSLPLVLSVLPDLVREQQEPLAWMRQFGSDLGLIRPSSRRELLVPEVPQEQLLLPAADLPRERPARYQSYGDGPQSRQSNSTASKTALTSTGGSICRTGRSAGTGCRRRATEPALPKNTDARSRYPRPRPNQVHPLGREIAESHHRHILSPSLPPQARER